MTRAIAQASPCVLPDGARRRAGTGESKALADALRDGATTAVARRFRVALRLPGMTRREVGAKTTPSEVANGSRLSGFACGRDDGLRRRRGPGFPLRSHPGQAERDPGAIGCQSDGETHRPLLASSRTARERRAGTSESKALADALRDGATTAVTRRFRVALRLPGMTMREGGARSRADAALCRRRDLSGTTCGYWIPVFGYAETGTTTEGTRAVTRAAFR